MSRLRWQLRTYIVGVILAGALGLALAAFGPRPSATEDLLVVGILLGLATLAQIWPVHLSLKIQLTVDDTPLFAAALLLGPFLAILVAGASALVGPHLRHAPTPSANPAAPPPARAAGVTAPAGRPPRTARMPWCNRAFTAAVSGLATGAAAVVYLVMAD